jgi:hypothetical protein
MFESGMITTEMWTHNISVVVSVQGTPCEIPHRNSKRIIYHEISAFQGGECGMIAFWNMVTCSLVEDRRFCRMMEAASTTETSIYYYEPTESNIPAAYHLQDNNS